LSVILFALVLFAYELFDLWGSPYWTAWLILAYFAGALAIDSSFQHAPFCKYVCPIGQFQFVGSLVSPLEVKVREPDACARCTTHDCLRGNSRQRGCELDLFLPRKAGSVDCTFCLDCVKACPHDNIGILPVLPGRELVSDPARSSVGRFAARPDLAVLVLVFTVGAFVNAFAMLRPASAAAFAALCGGAALLAAVLVPRELRPRLALTLVPLGLAMWAAHFLFHLFAGWASGWPALVQALGVEQVRWTGWGSLLSAPAVLGLQMALLDAGLLLTLYAAWRVSGASRTFLPWAAVAAGLWLAGVWIYLQPMPMRGMVH
jgi:ferredoxin